MRRILIAVAAIALLAAACGGDDGEEATGATEATGVTAVTGPTAATGPTAVTGPTASGDCVDLTGEGEIFTITISNFAFVPDCFTASASQGIKIVNEDAAPHTFTMTGTDINIPLSANATFNGEPIAGLVEPGTYPFMCTIHPEMTGEVIVVA